MDSNLAQPCKKAICSEDSQDSNVVPSNSDVKALHDINCEDENLDAPETNATEIIVEQQSNDGDGAGINDGDRFINSSVGNEKGIMQNSHVRDNGLNDKKVKVEEGNKVEKEENSYVRSNGLNYKIMEIVEKGEKVERLKG